AKTQRREEIPVLSTLRLCVYARSFSGLCTASSGWGSAPLALLRHEPSRRASKVSACVDTQTEPTARDVAARRSLAEPGRSSVSLDSRFTPGCSPRPTRFADLTQ